MSDQDFSSLSAFATRQTQTRRLFEGIAAALFDLDGTLIETHIDFPAMKQATLMLAARYGLDTELLAARDILGVVEGAREILHESGQADAATRFHTEAFALLADIETTQCAAPVLLPGAAELLAALHARAVPVAIVTRNCRAVSERLLVHGDLRCDALLTRDDVARTKPHPDHLHDALRALAARRPGVALPSAACLMVGDNWMDVAAGHAAGMRTLGLRRDRPADHFAPAPPDLLLNDMAELWILLRNEE